MSRKIKVDMTGVESSIRCAEGEHIVVLKDVEEGTTSNGDDKLTAKFEVTKGSSAGAIIYETFTLTEKALFKLKQYLDAICMKSEGKIQLDLDKLIGKTCIVEVRHEEYNGTNRAKIDQYKKFEAADEEDEDEDDEDDEPVPPKKKSKPEPKKEEPKKKKKPEPEPVEDDEEDEDEDDEDDEPVPPKKSKKPEPKKPVKKEEPKKKKKPVEDDDDEEDDWEED